MSETTIKSFATFGKPFQEKLAHLIVKDREFSEQIGEVLDSNFFEYKYLQLFVRKIFDYKNKYRTHPSYETCHMIVKTEFVDQPETLQSQISDYFLRIYVDRDNDIPDGKYIKDNSLDFCRKQKLYDAIKKSIELIDKSSFENVSQIILEALKLGTDNDLGYELIADFEDRYTPKRRNPVSTGWELLDGVTKGGIGRGELGVVIAPSGVGKSLTMVHLGAEALKEGKTVLYYTLELSDSYVGMRFDSCLTRVPMNDLYICKDFILEELKKIPGKLIIKEYPTKSASIVTIRNHLEKLRRRNIVADMIIIDYADLLKSTKNYGEKRYELETIYEDLRAIAQENSCPLWTCSQSNRKGLSEQIITMEQISEAYNKCFVADFIISLSRTMEDKVTNSGRLYIAKSRLGPDGIVFPIFMDPSNVTIKILQSDEQTKKSLMQNSKEKTSDVEVAKAREFYKKMLKENDELNAA